MHHQVLYTVHVDVQGTCTLVHLDANSIYVSSGFSGLIAQDFVMHTHIHCRTQSNKYAFDWYEKALHYMVEDEDGCFDATMDSPPYLIKAKMAELLLAGGGGLEKNPLRSGLS